MFLLGTAVGFFVFSVMCRIRYKTLKARQVSSDYDAESNTLLALGLLVVFVAFLVTGTGYYNQLSDIENLQKYEERRIILKKKAEALTQEFVGHLANRYPEHEKAIFEKIGPENVGIYLVKYPELRASETILELVKYINKLQSDAYNQELYIVNTKKEIRLRLRNPWIFNSWIPEK